MMITSEDLKNLTDRLEKLERWNRIYRGAALLLGALVVAAGVIAARPDIPDVVEARQFRVIGATGQPIAVLDGDGDGGRIVLKDNQGRGGIGCFSNEFGGAIGILDKNNGVVVRLGTSQKGGLLMLTNKANVPVFVAAATDNNDGAMVLFDSVGIERWHAP